MRQILYPLLALAILPLAQAEPCCVKAKKLQTSCKIATPLPKGDVLAVNTVEAQFLGIQHIPCRHMTAECPDRCNHATDVAQFRVIKNLDYKKDGEYGDDKADADAIIFVDVKKDIQGQSPRVAAEIKELQAGAIVKLTITHVYVDDQGNRYPVRPATSFKVLDAAPADVEKLAAPAVMPIAR